MILKSSVDPDRPHVLDIGSDDSLREKSCQKQLRLPGKTLYLKILKTVWTVHPQPTGGPHSRSSSCGQQQKGQPAPPVAALAAAMQQQGVAVLSCGHASACSSVHGQQHVYRKIVDTSAFPLLIFSRYR
ncbi:hypothetical protein VOLCADRAFT_96798 [Volvox carteri f. nagariensis]|uniref:Uncharacterized protein n=1 Tax=Volvox carteri f. nagariensis TaxID=3068 RepID=D8UB32_VOLCA|nr:uncharacterized protein VOLCADRAFT_96798 [Volvox carteri f. nagariensis]EFJ43101.1 hypothetical protein VOLCADRAFT_96798 [Volvox carteri f. nagariensis]|eukprot:XP_002955900.1 hypothetical protein VOLCADRAFT_96798 [Volvox carteri f. nagariensis]